MSAIVAEDAQQHLDQLVSEVSQLVTLPDVFMQFEQQLRDPNITIEDLVETVSSDINTAARLLKLANSSFFGFHQQVDTITRALILVGVQQVRDLMLATAVLDKFQALSFELINPQDFWRHSVAVGSTARCIAVHRRERNRERLFLLGLLHDVGRLVLYLKEPQAMNTLLQRAQTGSASLTALEVEHFGFSHAEVGAKLIERWDLPESLYLPVRLHHEPMAATEHVSETAILHIADVVVHSLSWGSSGEPRVPNVDMEAWQALGLAVEGVEGLVADSREMYLESVSQFL